MSWMTQPDAPGNWLLKNARGEVRVVRVCVNEKTKTLQVGIVATEDYTNHLWHEVIAPPDWNLKDKLIEAGELQPSGFGFTINADRAIEIVSAYLKGDPRP